MRTSLSVVVTAAAVGLAACPFAAAVTPLPPGGTQVNSDAASGIDPARAAGVADVVGGSTVATAAPAPWATFGQATSGAQQVFVRSYANGAWTTRGAGTVNGSGGSASFPGSLNFDQTQDAAAPAIDFAGAGRAVPWATWYETSSAFIGSASQIYASRFDAAQNKWYFSGQSRTGLTANPPSLNIDTTESAENPAVAGGSTTAGNDPLPWVVWDESADGSIIAGPQQVFVTRAIKQASPGTPCPGGTKPAGGNDVGGYCWQQVGTERAGSGSSEPSLNIDRGRNGTAPDVAFAGSSDTIPWVVWTESGTGSSGLSSTSMVFAAKAVPSSAAGTDGGFQWHPVGSGTAGLTEVLDNTTTSCAASLSAEDACALNKSASSDAENIRVAAGTMTAGGIDVPWVVWDEKVSGVSQVFAARLVGGDHFEVANNGAPLSTSSDGAVRPDITFSGNTPYVTWQQKVSGVFRTFTGHLTNAAAPTFALDNSGTGTSSQGNVADVRSPISSTCHVGFDGTTCPGGALGTPFYLQTDGATTSAKLLAQAYGPDQVTTGIVSGITTSTADVSGSLNPGGTAARVHFDVGTTTAYGSATPAVTIAPGDAPVTLSAALSNLPAGTVIHYRTVATTDFGTVAGADQFFTTAKAVVKDTTPPKMTVTGKVPLAKVVKAKHLKLTVSLSEAGKVTIQVLIGKKVVGKHTTTFTRKGKVAMTVTFTKANLKLLAKAAKKKVTVKVTCVDRAGNKGKAVTLHAI